MAENNQAKTFTEEEMTALLADARAAGIAEGAKGAMGRINAILDSEAAKHRPNAALKAALKTSMNSDEAIGFLAELPVEGKAAPTRGKDEAAGLPRGMFAAAMEAEEKKIPSLDTVETDETETQAVSVLRVVKTAGLPGFR